MTNAFLPALRRSAHPRIVNISSGTGALAWATGPQFPHRGTYAAYRSSNAALTALTVYYAHALADDGIKVNALAPGLHRTDLNATAASNVTRPRPRRARSDWRCCQTRAVRGVLLLGRDAGPLAGAAPNDPSDAPSQCGRKRAQAIPIGGYFAQVRKDSVALRDGLPIRPRAQLAGFAGCRGIRLITRSGRYRVA